MEAGKPPKNDVADLEKMDGQNQRNSHRQRCDTGGNENNSERHEQLERMDTGL